MVSMIEHHANKGKLKKANYFILALFILAMLHMLRNLTPVYLVLYAITSAAVVFDLIVRSGLFVRSLSNFAWPAFLSGYVVSVSLLQAPNYGDPTIGLARFFFIAPLVFAIIASIEHRSAALFFSAWLAFVVISALSLPFQFVFGPIGWFSESFERAGLERFGSLAGSLTTFGNIAGAGAFLSLVIPRRTSVSALLLVIIIAGAVASLQKAAILSLAIGFITGIWVRGVMRSTALVVVIMVVVSMMITFIFLDRYLQNILITLFETFIGTADARIASDVSFLQSMVDRMTELPSIALTFHGSDRLLFGVGVFGGSGGLGYSDIPHPHNLVVENFIVFGLFGGSICLIFLMRLYFKSLKVLLQTSFETRGTVRIAAGSLVNLIIPSLFAGGLFFHPASASLFWLSALILLSPNGDRA
ncbi:hypothetical protein [Porphyrobacter sp. HT-58-2]|uniref:hypothetical protein n=1 Tax=Porphyrobacter sp. HT-58-2 TaxID=2023229 RepID=UPI0011B06BB4|nr:hypothetical protein [Porphyrobacter sp. HT-58-2]